MASNSKQNNLWHAIVVIDDPKLAKRFFEDICTPAEIEALGDRLEVARLLNKEISYREISDMTGTSTATITRVARSLHHGHQGYNEILSKLNLKIGKDNESKNKTSSPKIRKT